MISARSRALPAIAVPGDDAWEAEWAPLFAGRRVSVVFDCDHAGREAAARIAADLKPAGVRGSIVDLARGRTDGYDLTEWLAERGELGAQELRRALEAPDAGPRADVPTCRRADGWQVTVGGYAATSPGSLSPDRSSPERPLSVMAVPRVRIARTVPCETWAAAISRWESPESAGPADGQLVFAVGFALALGRARHVSRHVAAKLMSRA